MQAHDMLKLNIRLETKTTLLCLHLIHILIHNSNVLQDMSNSEHLYLVTFPIPVILLSHIFRKVKHFQLGFLPFVHFRMWESFYIIFIKIRITLAVVLTQNRMYGLLQLSICNCGRWLWVF